MRIGIALGGGGVRGLAHILVLEAMEDLGVKPDIVAGTSMGAIIGAMYSSGISPGEIKERVRQHFISSKDSLSDVLAKKQELLQWFRALAPGGSQGLIDATGFIETLLLGIEKRTFEELNIPLRVIAADYWSAEEVVFESGELQPALQASMAVPGVFAPVSYQDRVLVDGGVVNLVPYDRVQDEVDITIAVDVSKSHSPGEQSIPGPLESVLGTFTVMQGAALQEKMKQQKPNIFIKFDIPGVRMLEFGKIDQVFDQAVPTIDEFKEQLSSLLD
ncbi:patatin-like phospholipase family protein [Kaarinaea lacus]